MPEEKVEKVEEKVDKKEEEQKVDGKAEEKAPTILVVGTTPAGLLAAYLAAQTEASILITDQAR